MQYQGMQKNLNQKWAGRILSTRSMADEFRNDFWTFAFAEGRSYCRDESQCRDLVEMMMNEFAGEYSRNPLPSDIYSEMIVKLGLLYGKTGGKEKKNASFSGNAYPDSAGTSYNRTGYSGYAPGSYAARPGTPYGGYSGGYETGTNPGGYPGTASYGSGAGYRPGNYSPAGQQPYTGAESWRAPSQGRPAEGYSAYNPGGAGTGYAPGGDRGYPGGYGYGNPPAASGGYTQNPYAGPAGAGMVSPEPGRDVPPVQNAPGGWNAGNGFNSQSTSPQAAPAGYQPPQPAQAAETVPQPGAPAAAPQVPEAPVQPTNTQPVQVPGAQAGQPQAQPVQVAGAQAGQTPVYATPLQTAMPVGTIPMSTTVSVQPVMQIPVQPVMQASVQPQAQIPNLAGVQDILGMKGGADTPEAQDMLVQAARLIQAYNAATKSNVGEIVEEESEEESEIVEADPSKAASWRPPKFGFSRREKKAEKVQAPEAAAKGKKPKEEAARKKVDVPDAKPQNTTTRKQEKEDDGKSPTFSVINTILLILTGASVLFLIWETGLIQKLL
ncbi:MAG: hypothetical protein IJ088_10615 [Clostridia bacterium]|nr:hypothetical protein [Clostridia bacterium]